MINSRGTSMNDRENGKVISLRVWKQAKLIEENLDMGISYQSLISEVEERRRDDVKYFAVVYSIPAEDFPDEEFFYEPEETELFTVIRDKGVGEFNSWDNRGVERYEIYDVNTDDVHIMYRIPYKPPYPRLVKDKPSA
jgi:GTPase SAR1 family protein